MIYLVLQMWFALVVVAGIGFVTAWLLRGVGGAERSDELRAEIAALRAAMRAGEQDSARLARRIGELEADALQPAEALKARDVEIEALRRKIDELTARTRKRRATPADPAPLPLFRARRPRLKLTDIVEKDDGQASSDARRETVDEAS